MNFLSAVDYYGVFELDSDQVQEPIKKLVHLLKKDEILKSLCKRQFLSRNSDYYKADGSMKKLAEEREDLSANLPLTGATGYIVADKMSVLSGKCAHAAHMHGLKEEYFQAKECLDEDVGNLVGIMNGKEAKKTKFILPKLNDKMTFPKIELDNKPLIKLAVEAICAVDKPKCVLTPGNGTTFIGPMYKAYGVEYTKLKYSGYKNEDFDKKLTLQQCLPFSGINELPDDVLVFEDDICSGQTLANMQTMISQEGIKVKTGAVETIGLINKNITYLPGAKYYGRKAKISESINSAYPFEKFYEEKILIDIEAALQWFPKDEQYESSIAYNRKMKEIIISGRDATKN